MNDAIPRPQAKVRKALTPLLEIRNLTKSFDGQHAVDDVSLTIYKGEIFALLGASGCGKSTLLRMLAGFEQPTAGQIMLDGVDLSSVPPYQRPINMMFQSYALFPHMTVEQNIAFGLKQDKLPKAEITARVAEMLSLVHMQEFAKRKPHQLSGGQRQRVALARSLAKRPKLLLLDEPMGALDKKLRDRMQLEVVDILERVGVTCVMVTHDQEEAMTMAGRIAIMNRGKFVQIGEPEEIYEHPTTRYSAEFIGSVNVFEGLLKERQEDGLVIESPGLQHPLKVDPDSAVVDNVPVYVALRPEKIMLCDDPPADGYNFAVGEVVHIAYLGDLSIYHVRLKSGQMLSAQLQNEHRYVCFLVGGAALAALPLITAGFFSKDEILAGAMANGHINLMVAGLVGAFMTSLYTFRMIFIVFHGKEQIHAHAGKGITHHLPLIVLLVLSTFVGAMIVPPLQGVLPDTTELEHGRVLTLEITSGVVAIAGILIVAWLWLGKRTLVTAVANSAPGRLLGTWWYNAWGFDWLYDMIFVKPFLGIAWLLKRDPLNSLMNIPAILSRFAGKGLLYSENGYLRWYVASMSIGAVVVLALLMVLR